MRVAASTDNARRGKLGGGPELPLLSHAKHALLIRCRSGLSGISQFNSPATACGSVVLRSLSFARSRATSSSTYKTALRKAWLAPKNSPPRTSCQRSYAPLIALPGPLPCNACPANAGHAHSAGSPVAGGQACASRCPRSRAGGTNSHGAYTAESHYSGSSRWDRCSPKVFDPSTWVVLDCTPSDRTRSALATPSGLPRGAERGERCDAYLPAYERGGVAEVAFAGDAFAEGMGKGYLRFRKPDSPDLDFVMGSAESHGRRAGHPCAGLR